MQWTIIQHNWQFRETDRAGCPYIKEIPNSKIPEEKADDRIIFMDASEDILFSRSKFAIAATGRVASSSDKKNMSRLPLEIIKNMPNSADSISIKNSGICSFLFSQSANNKDIRYTPRLKILFWKAIVPLVVKRPPKRAPVSLKKNPKTKLASSRNCTADKSRSFLVPLPTFMNSRRKMIKVITSSDFIKLRNSFNIRLNVNPSLPDVMPVLV